MNFKIDLTKQQMLLEQIDITVEEITYTKEEINHCINKITSHIMNRSSKNGDLFELLIK